MSQKLEHIMDLILEFREIIMKLEAIKKHVVTESKISYTSQDARMVALDNLQISISAVGMWIQCCNSLANLHTKEGIFDETDFLKSVGSGLNALQTEIIMHSHLRLSFTTIIHFKFDNLFYNILRHLNALPWKTGYFNLTSAILDECFDKNRDVIKEKKDILTAFANIRNSLHANGIHRNNDLKIKIDEKEFNFINGSPVACDTWEHIVVLLKANVEILETIIQSDKVKNIKTEIKDDAASRI
jgi:hypothetical protein